MNQMEASDSTLATEQAGMQKYRCQNNKFMTHFMKHQFC